MQSTPQDIRVWCGTSVGGLICTYPLFFPMCDLAEKRLGPGDGGSRALRAAAEAGEEEHEDPDASAASASGFGEGMA
jgi:hypothetical protein